MFAFSSYYMQQMLQLILGIECQGENITADLCIRLVGGGLAGITAASVTYPLDLVRTRLAAQCILFLQRSPSSSPSKCSTRCKLRLSSTIFSGSCFLLAYPTAKQICRMFRHDPVDSNNEFFLLPWSSALVEVAVLDDSCLAIEGKGIGNGMWITTSVVNGM
ncbi:hypothetical protein H5410_031153 [Solanum commersonii]|uniref:Uncharacterized protein n=1 Tax=Solanum commersonii TaxID=4109 RepID=A0A9J5YJ32_SOLCO|nr:hypothetical protein H5410_031153 [Solanum commersonii]